MSTIYNGLICLLGLISLLVPAFRAQESLANSAIKTPYIERENREFSFYPGGKLEIATAIPGNVSIVGRQRGSVLLEVEKLVYYQEPENAKALLKENTVRIRHIQTSASVQIPKPSQAGAVLEFNLTFYVPGEKTDLNIIISQGDLSIDSVNGWVEVSIGQGSLEIKDMAGYFSATTRKGDIYVQMSGHRWRGLEFAALTYRGSVDLKMPRNYSATLQLDTRKGRILFDYPPRMVDGQPELPAIFTRKNAQTLKGAVGDGGPPIKLASYSGNISVSAKE